MAKGGMHPVAKDMTGCRKCSGTKKCELCKNMKVKATSRAERLATKLAKKKKKYNFYPYCTNFPNRYVTSLDNSF